MQKSTELMKAIAQESQARKAENYQLLKSWDQAREETLRFHRRTIEELTQQIELRIKQSREYQQTLMRFLQDKSEQQVRAVSLRSIMLPMRFPIRAKLQPSTSLAVASMAHVILP